MGPRLFSRSSTAKNTNGPVSCGVPERKMCVGGAINTDKQKESDWSYSYSFMCKIQTFLQGHLHYPLANSPRCTKHKNSFSHFDKTEGTF